MKMKYFAALALLSAGVTGTFAQKGVEDGSRFGHGEDSIRCLKNISIYTEYVKTNNFKDAYEPWKAVFTEAPYAQVGTYTNGAKILRWMIANEKDATKQQALFDELMTVYDQYIANLDRLNKLVRKPISRGSVVGSKAHYYYTMAGSKLDLNQAYALFNEAVEAEKSEADYYVLQEFIDASSRKFKTEESHRERFIQDYMTASKYTEEALAKATKEKDKKNYAMVKENLDAYLVNSGAANCDMLQSIYGAKVEENKANLDYLKNVVSVMKMLRCTEQEAYFNASLYAHQISPTAETAVGCAYMSFKKEKVEDAVKFLDQAIELETEDTKKAEYAYTAAQMLSSTKSYSRARQYAQKAIGLNGNYGAPYILIAQMYASSPNWSDESALNRCTYYLAIDKLQRAKNVDPSVADEAQKLINAYAGHTPKAEDLFFLNLKKGDSVTIGGWIGESTVIR